MLGYVGSSRLSRVGLVVKRRGRLSERRGV